jgi:hypothetical protein
MKAVLRYLKRNGGGVGVVERRLFWEEHDDHHPRAFGSLRDSLATLPNVAYIPKPK